MFSSTVSYDGATTLDDEEEYEYEEYDEEVEVTGEEGHGEGSPPHTAFTLQWPSNPAHLSVPPPTSRQSTPSMTRSGHSKEEVFVDDERLAELRR